MAVRALGRPNSRSNISRLAVATCIFLSIQGCSRHSDGQAIVYGADGFEIPRAELAQALAAATASGFPKPQAYVLQRVVQQKLFAQAARAAKLDRDLKVVQTIEAAKREILAGAYVEQLLNSIPPPSQDKIDTFYHDHPELFSSRRLFALDEISVNGDPALLAGLEKPFMGSGGKLGAVQALLARRGVSAPVVQVRRAPQDIDAAEASDFGRLKVGDSVIYKMSGDVHFAVVTSAEASPLSLKQAEPLIRNLLVTQARRTLIDGEAARLQAAAHLVYAKGYAPAPPAGT